MTITHPERTLSLSRVYQATPALLLEMFSVPAHLNKWWGPIGFSTTTHEMAFEPGGWWILTMHGPDGRDYPNRLQYHVTGPDRITYTHYGDGDTVHFSGVIEFEPVSTTETRMTFTMIFPTVEEKVLCVDAYGADKGLTETMGRLFDLVASGGVKRPFVLSRVFDAPRDLLWRVVSEEKHLAQWFGPKDFERVRCSMDLRPGGLYHYCLRSPDGFEFWGKWLIREVEPPERIVFVVSFCDAEARTVTHPMAPDWPREIHSVFTLAEEQGKTRLTIESTALGTDSEIAAFDQGRESLAGGWGGTFALLREYLDTVRA